MIDKQWLLVLIPVICNGLLIWALQALITNRVERRTRFNQLREDVFKNYISLIEKAIDASRNASVTHFSGKKNDPQSVKDIKDALWELREAIKELYLYYIDYSVILSTNRIVRLQHQELQERFHEWIENWNNAQSQVSFIYYSEIILHRLLDGSLCHVFGIKYEQGQRSYYEMEMIEQQDL